ncbi:heme peroxidase [Mucor velutinosus]|uniref:Heme peroxidase n=1 Tax=Mucor velutinosus TaxID=708070 RepID=A0AAN7DR45_9FUNG|nr:heme peroxidase [Mucor velutinosus]
MDGNQSENDRINQQFIQEALSSQLDQQHQQHQQQPQQNSYTAYFSNDNVQTIAGNANNFETLAPFQNFASHSLLYMQHQGISSSASSNNTMDPTKQQRVDIIESNAIQDENEYIYQQYLQMMNNHSYHPTTLDSNLQGYVSQQQQQQQQTPAIPARQEQDVFNELLNMASMNNMQNNVWHSEQTHTTAFINNLDTSTLITQQGQDASCYNPTAANPPNNAHFSLPLQADKNAKSGIVLQKDYEHLFANEYRDYKLEIVQQPSRARMCGFGDKDRRPISPPPILKLTVFTKNGNIIDPETFDISFLVVMCDACQEHVAQKADDKASSSMDVVQSGQFTTQVVSFSNSTEHELESDRYTATKLKNLVGASVASATKLYDLDGKLGIFFIFQDISLRTEGLFRLQFSLTDIGS